MTVKFVQANRISTAGVSEPPEEEKVCVVEEAPVTIAVEDGGSYTVLCTPVDKREMAIGFLFTEGVVEGMIDIEAVEEDDDDPNTVRVRLAGKTPRIWEAGRNMMIVSSCGACGSENLKEALEALSRVGDTFRIDAERVHSVYGAMRERQSLFEACGGTHAAAVFDEDGKIVSSAEDTGRHTALDKAIGRCLLAGIRLEGRGVALTSRLSMEMVAKCARVGVELITAVSAPTSMAIDLAQSCNITLCAFVREKRATVFTHPARVVRP
jgi:FdhD protein